MKLVIIESPYAGEVEANVTYARACMAHSIHRGEAPIASHLIYTQPGILRDNIPIERSLGINAGFAWGDVADFSAFYTDRGWSSGMLAALHRSLRLGRIFKLRSITDTPILPATLHEEIEAQLRANIELS